MTKKKSKAIKKLVSDAVAKSQQANSYHQARRSRLHQMSKVEERKFLSALSDQMDPFGWCLTYSCKIIPVKRDERITAWRIRLLKRGGGKSSKYKGQEKKSSEYESQLAAENALYEYRRSMESKNSKKRLDEWTQSLHSSYVPTELIVEESMPQEQPTTRHLSMSTKKAIAMSADPLVRKQFGIPCRNPKTSQGSLLQYSKECAAQRVQGYIRSRQLLRGVRAEVRVKSDQTYRELILAYLKKLISAPRHKEKWRQLLLGADNN
jgi:hypothetical protein